MEHAAVEGLAVDEQKAEGRQENAADHVFAHDLELRQTRSLDETGGESPGEYSEEQNDGHQNVDGERFSRMHRPPDEKQGREKGEAEEIPEGDPELRRQVRGVAGEDPHPLVGQRVRKVKRPGEEGGDAYEQQERVVLDTSRMPCQHEYDEGHEDVEQLHEAVEEQIDVKAARVQARSYQDDQESVRCFSPGGILYDRDVHKGFECRIFWNPVPASTRNNESILTERRGKCNNPRQIIEQSRGRKAFAILRDAEGREYVVGGHAHQQLPAGPQHARD